MKRCPECGHYLGMVPFEGEEPPKNCKTHQLYDGLGAVLWEQAQECEQDDIWDYCHDYDILFGPGSE